MFFLFVGIATVTICPLYRKLQAMTSTEIRYRGTYACDDQRFKHQGNHKRIEITIGKPESELD